jgi:hypothetical protein
MPDVFNRSLLSKAGLEQGYHRRLSIDLFSDPAFVLAETTPEAVAEYAHLRAHDKTPQDAFAQAFGPYFLADHVVGDLYAAADHYEAALRAEPT